MIEILLKGLSTNKSWSPVMIQSACPESASSRYLLSLKSRHAVTVWTISMRSALLLKFKARLNRVGKSTYLSNFGLGNFSFISRSVGSEVNKVCSVRTLKSTSDGMDFSTRNALIRIFVSITTLIHSRSRRISSNFSWVRPFSLACFCESDIISSNVLLSSKTRCNMSIRPSISCWLMFIRWLASLSLTDRETVLITNLDLKCNKFDLEKDRYFVFF